MKLQELQVTAFPLDNQMAHSSRIEITRYSNYIEVKQDNYILGSIKLMEDVAALSDYAFDYVPMVVITVLNGAKPKQ